MRVALASPPFPKSIDDGLAWIKKFIKKAASKNADIICFPEAYIPGQRGTDYTVCGYTQKDYERARDQVSAMAKKYNINVILPMEWHDEKGVLNVAFVISKDGEILGCQTKNQLDPSEDDIYVCGDRRELFEINGILIGVVICFEGFCCPESVRWAAVEGAVIVFHPHFSGSGINGKPLVEWNGSNNPYNEKAMICRAIENTIYFASINYAMKFQDCATSIIAPDGKCISWLEYGKADILVSDIDLDKATRKLALRYRHGLYN